MTLNIEIGVFMDFLVILGCKTHFKSKLHRIHYRRTKRSCIWNFQHWTQILMVQVSTF